MRHSWTEAEKNKLREFVPGHFIYEIRDEMERTFGWRPNVAQIKNMQQKLNVRCGKQWSWPKGHPPHNKGKHYNAGGRSVETRFKKGTIPPNYRPVGSKRLTVDGYHMVKIADPNVWILTHKLIYEQHYGKVPDGEFVIFLDRNKNNLDIDNLISVTRGELAKINKRGILDYPKELKRSAVIAIKLEENVRKGRPTDSNPSGSVGKNKVSEPGQV